MDDLFTPELATHTVATLHSTSGRGGTLSALVFKPKANSMLSHYKSVILSPKKAGKPSGAIASNRPADSTS